MGGREGGREGEEKGREKQGGSNYVVHVYYNRETQSGI